MEEGGRRGSNWHRCSFGIKARLSHADADGSMAWHGMAVHGKVVQQWRRLVVRGAGTA